MPEHTARDIMDRLFTSSSVHDGRAPAVTIVAAHPDDETIGAGGLLCLISRLRPNVIHCTDGAPEAPGGGSENEVSRLSYASQRRKELLCAMKIAGVPPERCLEIGLKDQGASYNLHDLALRLHELLKELTPEIILTHSYEGGHPDHDATCFGVHAAATWLSGNGANPAPHIIEFPTYHAEQDGMAAGVFLPAHPDPGACIFELSPDVRRKKQSMIACFVSQRQSLADFPSEREVFRIAPAYDFRKPPHSGQLFYERFAWGITGLLWRECAARALEEPELA